MSFVNGYASELLLLVDEFQMSSKAIGCALFRGNIKKVGDRVASGEVLEETLSIGV